jgi:hypothetical protein
MFTQKIKNNFYDKMFVTPQHISKGELVKDPKTTIFVSIL